MQDEEQLSALIGDIYDAGSDPSLWNNVLEKSARFVGGPASTLFWKDVGRRASYRVYEYGIDGRYQRLYLAEYIVLDPAATRHHSAIGAGTTRRIFARTEQPIAGTDLAPYDEFLKTRFYREWARPQGLVDFVASVLDNTATNTAMFGVFRHERDGLTDDEARRSMRLIVPHLRRAMLVHRLMDLRQAETQTFADALDCLSAGMFLIGTDGQVVHANAAGHAILATNDFLRLISGRLVAGDAQVNQALRAILAGHRGTGEIGVKSMALPLTARDGERHVAHVLPLMSAASRRAGIANTAALALIVQKAALKRPCLPDVIAKTYRLTPAELRVLLAIVEVGGAREVAEAFGVGEATVRTHLGRLFEKTGASRQVDLVKVVAGFSNPLVN
jgi:DNA-binding CsgD family transcriptional regulator